MPERMMKILDRMRTILEWVLIISTMALIAGSVVFIINLVATPQSNRPVIWHYIDMDGNEGEANACSFGTCRTDAGKYIQVKECWKE